MSEVPHPSDFIAEEMLARGWTADELAARMCDGTEYDFSVCRLALDFYDSVGPDEPNMRIGKVTAHKFANAFDVSPEFFINLEAAWLASIAHLKEDRP